MMCPICKGSHYLVGKDNIAQCNGCGVRAELRLFLAFNRLR